MAIRVCQRRPRPPGGYGRSPSPVIRKNRIMIIISIHNLYMPCTHKLRTSPPESRGISRCVVDRACHPRRRPGCPASCLCVRQSGYSSIHTPPPPTLPGLLGTCSYVRNGTSKNPSALTNGTGETRLFVCWITCTDKAVGQCDRSIKKKKKCAMRAPHCRSVRADQHIHDLSRYVCVQVASHGRYSG